MGQLFIKSNIDGLTPGQIQIIENKLHAFLNSNPEAVKLVQEATQDRDITIRVEDKEHPFGAHWENDINNVVMFISGIKFNEISDEQLNQLLDADLQDDDSSAYAVIFELCNAVNDKLNNPEMTYIDFANRDDYAKYMESLEFLSFQRAVAIAQYGHQHCGWKEVKSYDASDFERYFAQMQASNTGAKHIQYYRDNYVAIVSAITVCITGLNATLAESIDYFNKLLLAYHTNFAVNTARIYSHEMGTADSRLFGLGCDHLHSMYASELTSLDNNHNLIETYYHNVIYMIANLKTVATETLREGSVDHRKYKKDLIKKIEDFQKETHESFMAFCKEHTKNRDTLHTNRLAVSEVEKNLLRGEKASLQELAENRRAAFGKALKTADDFREDVCRIYQPSTQKVLTTLDSFFQPAPEAAGPVATTSTVENAAAESAVPLATTTVENSLK